MVENDSRLFFCSEVKTPTSLQDEKVRVSGSGTAS
jgi:hypothetical protein